MLIDLFDYFQNFKPFSAITVNLLGYILKGLSFSKNY